MTARTGFFLNFGINRDSSAGGLARLLLLSRVVRSKKESAPQLLFLLSFGLLSYWSRNNVQLWMLSWY